MSLSVTLPVLKRQTTTTTSSLELVLDVIRAASWENQQCGFRTGLTQFPNRSDTNRAVQAQKQAGSLKFRI